MVTDAVAVDEVIKRKRVAAQRPNSADNLLGSLLLAQGVLTELDIQQILAAQQEADLRFGELALRLGLAEEHQIRRALALQYEYPYGSGPADVDPGLFMAGDPFGPRAEAVRALRSEVTLRLANTRIKTLAVISGRPNEGCSSIAANLAIAFAQTGERTLLIDANLRSPRQGDLFRMGTSPGLSSVLGGRISIKEAIVTVPAFAHLSSLCAGPSVPNPQELLGRVAFTYAMETLPASFDVVIVDTPPLLESADAQIIAARAGACILSTRRHATSLGDLARCKAKLDPSGALVLGVVVND